MRTSGHRLLAVFAADAVGFSRLMADDDAATVAILDQCRAVFREHIESGNGRVVDMAGDSILAVFDSATLAVETANSVQLTLADQMSALAENRRMHFRIGVNVGEVIEKADGTVYGDGVNIAARLESLAEPGTVCVSGNVIEQVEGKLPLRFKFSGEQRVKNIPKPVPVYVLQSTTSSADPPEPGAAAKVAQKVQFCTSTDGVSIAYSVIGQGPPLIKTGNWLNHLEFDLESPIWRHLLRDFAKHHSLVRYDARGNGLSDWSAQDISIDAFENDLEAVVDAAGFDRFPLLGISQGCAVSIMYAVKHPERVSGLVLYGGYARGRNKRGSKEQVDAAEAFNILIRQGWGGENPAFRQLFTSLFVPGASEEQMAWFNELQRVTTSPDNAVRTRLAINSLDVTHLLAQIRVPTLVLHCRDDAMVPFEEGRRMAAMIPQARFVALEGRNHLILENEPAWGRFREEVESFLANELHQENPSS
jgi:class 3 adenylate cyclase/pimeloyl-ACP methyl ester carboxylesterase